jgi:hypothetical protein
LVPQQATPRLHWQNVQSLLSGGLLCWMLKPPACRCAENA